MQPRFSRCSLISLISLIALAACHDDAPADGGLPTEDYLALATPMHDALYRLAPAAPTDDRVTGTCAAAPGPEHRYRFVAPADGIAHFAWRGANPVVYVRRQLDDAASELACSADVDPVSHAAEIYFAMTAGETYYVVADIAGADDGAAERLDFELRPSFPALTGTYRSRGYGLVLAFRDGEFALREESALHCMTVLAGPIAELAAIIDHVEPASGTLVVKPQLAAGTIAFEPLATTPPACAGAGTPVIGSDGYQRDARALFDIFVETFREHYAFFARRGIDWEAAVTAARDGLTADTADAALFERLAALIEPLHDGHVALASDTDELESKPQEIATILAAEHAALGLPGDVADYLHHQLLRIRAIAEAALTGPIARHEKLFVAGRLAANVAYLRLDHFLVPRAEQPLYLAALDRALATLGDTDRLVVDLRLNGGGSDTVAIEVANRLARSPGVFARKQARDGSALTPAIDLAVAPRADRYRGDVVVLVNGSTASAAETFVLALRGQPGIAIVGWPTSGELSDILSRTLPNGWSFGLSNEIYRDAAGALYEATGIAPDRALAGDPFPRADRLDGVDRVLAAALAAPR